MKRIWSVLLALLLAGCAAAPNAETESQELIPQELCSIWISASGGERNIIETMTFREDGTFSVHCDYNGANAGTISGVFHVEDNRLITNIQEGTAPYTAEFEYKIDGRELYLTDDSGTAHYLRSE